MAKQITEKSTKAEILEAYNQKVTELKEKEQGKFDPTAKANETKKQEVIKKVEGARIKELGSLVETIQNNMQILSDSMDVYNETNQAIEIKKLELKEMFEIEKSAYTLSALVNTQAELKVKFETEMKEKETELKRLVEETNLQIKTAKESAMADIRKMNEEEKLSRKKESETYDYETTRKRKIETDKFYDELALKTKEYELKMNDLLSREANIKQLESTIETLKAEKEEAVKVATEQATSKAKTAYTFETNYIKKDYEGKINLLENKIETLTDALSDSKSTITTLTNKLDEAYAKIEAMAKATIDGAGSKDMIATLKTALSEKGTNSK